MPAREASKYFFTTAFAVLFLLLSSADTSATPLSFYQKKIYKAYISDDMSLWRQTMSQMEKDPQKDQSDLFLLHLSITQYGYIGYLMGKEYHTSARKTIDKTTVNVEKLKSSRYASEAYALLAGLNGFEIGLAKHKAPFLGRKSEKYVEKAINLSSTNPMGWVEKGNIYYHMPGFFGGSYQKAIRYYAKAVGNFSKHSYLPKWLKLNALVWLGKSYEANEQYEQALKTYKKALEVEPGFSWVRDELYPQLKKKL